MSGKIKRNEAFRLLGTKPTNNRWAWCALAEDSSYAVFTVWQDAIRNGRNRLWKEGSPVNQRLGARDQRRILDIVISRKIKVYGLICIANDVKAETRSIKAVLTDKLLVLDLQRDRSGDILARHRKSVDFLELCLKVEADRRKQSKDGLQDLSVPPKGNETPDRAATCGWTVVRDEKVRRYVLEVANGRCEFCGRKGFAMPNGGFYLEAHHVIALAAKGKDTCDNVIALCAAHHREAHYGVIGEKLEKLFLQKIRQRQKRIRATSPYSR